MKETKEAGAEEKIIAAARRVFIKKGRESATMADIAKEAGISRTSLNYYFRSKEKLFDGAFEGVLKSVLPHIEKIITDESGALEKFAKIIDVHTAMLLKTPDMPLFIMGEINRDAPSLITRARKILGPQNVVRRFGEQIEAEMALGKLRRLPLADVANVYLGVMLFPFLIKNALEIVFFKNSGEEFKNFVAARRALALEILTGTLKP